MATSSYVRRRRQRRRDALAAYSSRATSPGNLDRTFWTVDRLLGIQSGDVRYPYRQHTWVYAAASWIAQNLSAVPFKIYRGDADEPDEVMSGPWYDLFARPNPEMSGREFWELSWLYLMLPPGECFWVLHTEQGDLVGPGQVPRWIYAYSGRHFEPVAREGGQITGWKMQIAGGQSRVFELHQVVHHRIPNPYDPMRGQSPIEAATRAIRSDVKAQDWNEAILDNDATPPLILKLPGATPEQAKAYKAMWEDRHAGPGKAGRLGILNHEKADAIKLGLTHTEMGFQAQREWSRQEVATAYKLPLFVLSVLGDVHRETSREALKLAWESGCIPHARRAESVLDAQLFRGRARAGREMAGVSANAEWGAFDFSAVDALQRDANERRQIALQDRDLGFSRNAVNARHELGYDTAEAEPDGSTVGDVGLVPISLQPLRDAEMALDLSMPEEEPEAGPVPPELAPDEEDVEEEEDEERAVRQRRLARLLSWRVYMKSVRLPAERRMARKIATYFYRRRAEVLKRIEDMGRAAEGRTRAITESEFEDWLDAQRARWDELLASDTRPATEQAIRASYDRLAQQLGQPLTEIGMSSPETLRIMEEMGARKGRFVNKTLSTILRDEMRGLLTQEATIEDITKRIKSVFQGLGTSQAKTIAVTEVGAATSAANFAAYQAEGIEKHSWLSSGEDNVRESHQIDDEVRPLGQPFSNGLMYPLDPDGPPEEVINCYLPGTVVGGAFVAGSEADYSGPAREIVTRWGNRLRVTPNHPVLGLDGWRAAASLEVGMQLVRYRGDVRTLVLTDPDHDHGPSAIEDVLNAIAAHGGRALAPVGGLDFHGDGESIDGQVRVVVPYRALLADFMAEGPKLLRQLGFISPDSVEPALHRLRALDLLSKTDAPSAGSVPSLATLTLDRLAVVLRPLQEFRLRTSTEADSVLLEAAKKCGAADPDGVRDLLWRFPGLVAADEIVEVRDLEWSGHVYDLQSTTGAMIAQNIISSNCHCTTLPEV